MPRLLSRSDGPNVPWRTDPRHLDRYGRPGDESGGAQCSLPARRTGRMMMTGSTLTTAEPSGSSQIGAKAGHGQGMTHPVIVVRQSGRKPLYVEIREPIDIGRECDGIIVADPQTSRRHATLSPRGESVVIEDLGSTNGTFLDGS